jgi:hypothetical protein
MAAQNPALELVPTVDRLLDMAETRRHEAYLDIVTAFSEVIGRAHVDDHFLDGPNAAHTRTADIARACRDALLVRYVAYPEVLADIIMAVCVGTALSDPAAHEVDRGREV